MMEASSVLPRTQAVYTQYTCTLGPKQPSTLLMARPTATHAMKQALKPRYIDKVLTNITNPPMGDLKLNGYSVVFL